MTEVAQFYLTEHTREASEAKALEVAGELERMRLGEVCLVKPNFRL